MASSDSNKNGNFNISRFKSQIQSRGGLTRGIFFECFITSLSGVPALQFKIDDTIVCKAVNLPTDTLDVAEIRYFTRAVRIPAARQFSPITLTFYNTINHDLRDKFIQWINLFNASKSNIRGAYEVGDNAGPANVSYGNLFTTLELTSFNNDGKLELKDLLNVGINTAISAAETVVSRINPILGSAGNQIGSKYMRQVESHNPPLVTHRYYQAYPVSISGLQFSQDDDGAYQTYDVEFQYLYSQIQNHKTPKTLVTTREEF